MKFENVSILVVDDDEAVLRALSKVLRGEGANVTSVSEMVEAVEVLADSSQAMDLVITDLRMPCSSGITLVYAIRSAFPGLPIIVLTAFCSAEVKAKCLELGASAFLEKPLDSQKLLDAVFNVLAWPRRTEAQSTCGV